MEAHGGVGIRSEQAHFSCRLRQRLFFLEKLFVLHRYACRPTDLFGYTLLSPTSMRWSILTITKPIISYLDKEKKYHHWSGMDGARRQDLVHGLGCFGLRRPWRGVRLHMFGYG